MNSHPEKSDKIKRIRLRILIGGIGVLGLFIGWRLSQSPPSLMHAKAEISAGNISKAVTLLNEFLKAHPDSEDGWKMLGKCLDSKKDYSSAADAYSQSLQRNPDSLPLLTLQAAALLKAARLEEAETAYREILGVNPTDEVARTELQWILFNQMRSRELEEFLETCLQHEPNNFQILFHLLYSSQHPPNPRETVGKMEMVEELQPGQAAIQLALGHCYWKLGEVEKARSLLMNSLLTSTRSLERVLLVAEFLIEQGDCQTAANLLIPPPNELKKWQSDDRWWWLKSKCELRKSDFSHALQFTQQASQLRPGEARYLVQEVSILRSLGKSDETHSLSQEILDLQEVERELYILVSRGDVNNPTAEICKKISRICLKMRKDLQAAGWAQLAN